MNIIFKKLRKFVIPIVLFTGIIGLFLSFYLFANNNKISETKIITIVKTPTIEKKVDSTDKYNNTSIARFDTASYNALLIHLVHGKITKKWPVRGDYPLPGAILPFKRIIAYYGNFYSPNMGVLGEPPPDEMIRKLKAELKYWKQADSIIPVQPALHYIAVSAQRSPGKNKKYRLRMPFTQIDNVMELAKISGAIVFLDIQIGHSSLQEEIPQLETYLRMPNVHLGIDPEYSMKTGAVPCKTIGSFDAVDINYAIEYLKTIVKQYHLPPKILVVHRFTKEMVTNYRQIKTCPEVQIVMNMDGFGFPAKKINSYKQTIANEPVQFTGFKIFYKNDKLSKPYMLMAPDEIIKLYPSPIYIQYQ